MRENSYHTLVLGLLYYVYGYRFPVSNCEAGDGRVDVLLVPEGEKEGKLPGIIIEVKWGEGLDGDALAALAAEALGQAGENSYAGVLPEGAKLKWGVAFSGKQVRAAVASAEAA